MTPWIGLFPWKNLGDAAPSYRGPSSGSRSFRPRGAKGAHLGAPHHIHTFGVPLKEESQARTTWLARGRHTRLKALRARTGHAWATVGPSRNWRRAPLAGSSRKTAARSQGPIRASASLADNGARLRAEAARRGPNLNRFCPYGPVIARGQEAYFRYSFKKLPLQTARLEYIVYPAPGYSFQILISSGNKTFKKFTEFSRNVSQTVVVDLGLLGLSKRFDLELVAALDPHSPVESALLIDNLSITFSRLISASAILLALLAIACFPYARKLYKQTAFRPETQRPPSRLHAWILAARCRLRDGKAGCVLLDSQGRVRRYLPILMGLLIVFVSGRKTLMRSAAFSYPDTEFSSDSLLYLELATAVWAGEGFSSFPAPQQATFAALRDAAKKAVEHRTFTKSCDREPLWPFLLEIGFRLFGYSRATLIFLQGVVLLPLTCFFLFRVSLLLFQSWPAALLSTYVFFHFRPTTSSFMVPLVQCFLVVLCLLSVQYLRSGKSKYLFIAAAICGLNALARYSFILLAPLFALLPLVVHWKERKKALALASLFLGLSLAPNVLWMARNKAAFGIFVHTTRGGWNLLARTYGKGMRQRPPYVCPEIVEKELNIRLPDEVRQSAVLLDPYYSKESPRQASTWAPVYVW